MPNFEVVNQYAEQLAGYSEQEEQLASQIAAQQRTETEQRMTGAIQRAQGDAAGIAAAQSDPSRLRGASYAQGAISAQGGADRALLQQLEEQAERERMMGVYGRRGAYGAEAAGAYGASVGDQAIEAAIRERWLAERDKQHDEEVSEAVGLFGSVAGGMMGAVASDRRLKRDIKRASPDDEDELASSVGYTYRYRPEAARTGARAPAGDRYGPMAQDLEKTKLGRSLVINTPAGKAVDTGAAAMAGLSIAGRLGDRIGKLENELASARGGK